MFGDDPDPTVTTVWVGSKEVSDTHARDRLELVGCAEGLELREERERGPAAVSEIETSDERPTTIAAIDNRRGVKQTPNAMKLGRRPTYNITTPHANFQPIPRTFSGHL